MGTSLCNQLYLHLKYLFAILLLYKFHFHEDVPHPPNVVTCESWICAILMEGSRKETLLLGGLLDRMTPGNVATPRQIPRRHLWQKILKNAQTSRNLRSP